MSHVNRQYNTVMVYVPLNTVCWPDWACTHGNSVLTKTSWEPRPVYAPPVCDEQARWLPKTRLLSLWGNDPPLPTLAAEPEGAPITWKPLEYYCHQLYLHLTADESTWRTPAVKTGSKVADWASATFCGKEHVSVGS